jgi:hypothetical protein
MVKFEDLEIWDHIKGYEGIYKVSSKGRVLSVKRNKILKPCSDLGGYHFMRLYKDGKPKSFKLHRLVALTFYFVHDGKLEIDHMDRNKTNNNLLNLRFCTRAENQSNRGIQKNNKSGYKGVSWNTQRNLWQAIITIRKKQRQIGCFNTKEEAYDAYCKASKELHGEYSYTP